MFTARALSRALAPSSLRAMQLVRCTAAAAAPAPAPLNDELSRVRNIGISAHIDSGKTTLTERILFYTNKIREIHEVRGKSGKGATMDSMDLERERGITIQSAATYTTWNNHTLNLIDTPGHIDFSIEVERALRVLDGAILVVCGASGVQSQTLTVDRQMRRYAVPRLTFINKLDRAGANPDRAVAQLRAKLHLNCALVQIPIGLEDELSGVIDIIEMRAIRFNGDHGVRVEYEPIPEALVAKAGAQRAALLEALADVDDGIAEIVLEDKTPTVPEIKAAIRRATIALKFSPVIIGSAFKNKGVQPLLDAVVDYLPNPRQVPNFALDLRDNEAKRSLFADPKLPFLGLAFKLDDSPHGLLTYMRVYQGVLKKGEYVYNVPRNEKVKVNRLVRMHANMMEDIQVGTAGTICAMFGVECSSGDTFTGAKDQWLSMTSMHVPNPVISLAIKPKVTGDSAKFSKGLGKFQREDPTLRVSYDEKTKETVISGMGELHLEIYVERLKREFGVECITGQPKVSFTEGLTRRVEFNHTHKKQSGGAGQFGRIIGYIEPLEEGSEESFVFEDAAVGNNIPPQFKPAIEKGAREAIERGPLTGHPITGMRFVITDGLSHAVDSNEMAFKTAGRNALWAAFMDAGPIVREPIMRVDIEAPIEYQGPVIAQVNQRKGIVVNTESAQDSVRVEAEVSLMRMFGYSTDLRGATQGKAEYSMEYKAHAPVDQGTQRELVDAFVKTRKGAGDL